MSSVDPVHERAILESVFEVTFSPVTAVGTAVSHRAGTWTVLVPEIVTTAQAAPAPASRVSVSYVPPKNARHQVIYEQLQEVDFLEKLQQFLTPFRLPRALLVKVEGCDGDANAFYENNVITICYEYVEQLRKTMPAETTAAGVAPIDALVGPLFDTSLHEFGHAMFEMLRLPVLASTLASILSTVSSVKRCGFSPRSSSLVCFAL